MTESNDQDQGLFPPFPHLMGRPGDEVKVPKIAAYLKGFPK